jgi:hypothetical protein
LSGFLSANPPALPYKGVEIFSFLFKIKNISLHHFIGDTKPELIVISESTISRDGEMVNVDVLELKINGQ